MFNSYVLTLFHRFYLKLKMYYSKSYLKKLENKLHDNLSIIVKSSIIFDFISNDTKSENIKAYKLYVKVVERIDKIAAFFRNKIKEYSKTSCTFNSISKLFDDKKATIQTVSTFALSFSLSLFVLRTANKNMSIETAMKLLVLFIIATLALFHSKKISTSIKESFFIKFVRGIFTIDDGEEISWK